MTGGGAIRSFLHGNVLWLSLISLLNDTASEMIFPLLPLFLVQVLGAGPAFLGLVEGVAEATSSLVKLASGWLSDRLGRRKTLVGWGYGIAAAVRPLIAAATLPGQVLVIRFVDRLGKGARTAPRDALLAESVVEARRGAAFGFHRGGDHIGAVLGPVVATGLLLLFPGELRLVFALAAIPGTLAVLILVWKVREVPPTAGHGAPASAELAELAGPANPGGSARPDAPAGMDAPASTDAAGGTDAPAGTEAAAAPSAFRRLDPGFRRYLLVLVLFTLGNASDAFLLLRAQQLGVAIALIPILWGALHISKSLWSLPGGMLSDRYGPTRTIVAGWLVYAAVYAGFGTAAVEWQIWVLFLVYGLFYGLTEAPEKSLVAALAPAGRRGVAFGAFHFAVGVAALPASLIFGAVWEAFSPTAAFLLGASLALLAALLLPFALRSGARPAA